MELKIRKLNESDWDTLVKMWQGWPEWKYIPSKAMLPENGTGGFIVEKGETPVVAGFLYTTNSKVGWVEWIVSNKDYKEPDRKDAIKLLITGIEHVAKQSDCEFILSVGRNQHLLLIHRELGYTVDKNPSYEISKKIK